MRNKKIKGIAFAAITAALYVLLTLLSAAFGLSGGVIQLRLSEALCVLPIYSPYAIPGLFIGCMLSNLITGCLIQDIIIGSLASLLGAVGAYLLRKFKWLTPIPNTAANTAIIPLLLAYVYHADEALPFLYLSVGIGEIISSFALGVLLLTALEKLNKKTGLLNF